MRISEQIDSMKEQTLGDVLEGIKTKQDRQEIEKVFSNVIGNPEVSDEEVVSFVRELLDNEDFGHDPIEAGWIVRILIRGGRNHLLLDLALMPSEPLQETAVYFSTADVFQKIVEHPSLQIDSYFDMAIRKRLQRPGAKMILSEKHQLRAAQIAKQGGEYLELRLLFSLQTICGPLVEQALQHPKRVVRLKALQGVSEETLMVEREQDTDKRAKRQKRKR